MSDSRVTRTVCVSNLAPAVNEQVLRDFFEYHGAISNIKISSGDPMVASSNRFGLIEFSTVESAASALLFDTASLHNYHVRVAPAEHSVHDVAEEALSITYAAAAGPSVKVPKRPNSPVSNKGQTSLSQIPVVEQERAPILSTPLKSIPTTTSSSSPFLPCHASSSFDSDPLGAVWLQASPFNPTAAAMYLLIFCILLSCGFYRDF